MLLFQQTRVCCLFWKLLPFFFLQLTLFAARSVSTSFAKDVLSSKTLTQCSEEDQLEVCNAPVTASVYKGVKKGIVLYTMFISQSNTRSNTDLTFVVFLMFICLKITYSKDFLFLLFLYRTKIINELINVASIFWTNGCLQFYSD